jgi:hypothetical protein
MHIRPYLIMQLGFGVFALGAFATVDYMTNAAVRGDGFTVGTYVSERLAQIKVVTGKVPKAPRVNDIFPPPPDGWEVRTFEREDLALVTGQPVEEQKKVSAGAAMMGGAIPLASIGSGGEYRTYTNGKKTVLLKISLLKTSAVNPIAGDAIKRMMEFQAGLSEIEDPLFATVNGMTFRIVNTKAYGVARRIEGKLGYQIDVDVVSTEDDDTILAILAGLDVAGLNQMIDEPIAGMGEGGIVRVASVDAQGADAVEEAALAGGDAPAAAPMAVAGRSLLGSLFGGKSKDAAPPPVAEPVEITCSIVQGAKRCKIGN